MEFTRVERKKQNFDKQRRSDGIVAGSDTVTDYNATLKGADFASDDGKTDSIYSKSKVVGSVYGS